MNYRRRIVVLAALVALVVKILIRNVIMGQAKLRGARDVRVAEAVKMVEAIKPDHIVCNNCQASLTEIITIDSRGMKGIEAAFLAHCSGCNRDTWAIGGNQEAVVALACSMSVEYGPNILITLKGGVKNDR